MIFARRLQAQDRKWMSRHKWKCRLHAKRYISVEVEVKAKARVIPVLNWGAPRTESKNYVCMYVCNYVVCMCACMYVNLYVCMYVSMYVSMYVCMYACMYVHTYRRTMASFASLPRAPPPRVPGMAGPFWAHHAQAQDQEMKVPLYYNMIYHTIPWYTPQQVLNKLIMLQTYSTIL